MRRPAQEIDHGMAFRRHTMVLNVDETDKGFRFANPVFVVFGYRLEGSFRFSI